MAIIYCNRCHEWSKIPTVRIGHCNHCGVNLYMADPNAFKETVDHPAHYGGKNSVYEHHKVVRAWGLNYHLGNATKYIARAGKKTPNPVEDLKKAIWYIQAEIDHLEVHGLKEK